MTWEKFKALSFRKKVEHIWEYYRWHILITVFVVCAVGSWIYGIATARDPYLQLEMINCYGASDDYTAFDPFLESQGRTLYEEDILLGKNIQFSDGRPGTDPTADYAALQLLMCTVAAGEPDMIFFDTRQVPPALASGVLLDLREVLSPELLREHEDQLVYTVDEESGAEYPCGIYMERNPWIMEHKYYVNCTVTLPFSCKDRPLAEAMIRYILSYED